MRHATALGHVGLLLLLASIVAFPGCSGSDVEQVDPPPIAAELQTELETWFAEHGQPPSDYVAGLFKDHDVVLLGEQHRFRHDPLFVQEMILRLHGEGVNVLATEFARREDQALLDALVISPEWNEDLGREILFRHNMSWGYREYLDVLKTAWIINRDRPAGSPLFRILGVFPTIDATVFKSEADWNDPAVTKLAMGDQTEADWAVPVLEAVAQGEKVLVHCGIHHGFTGFRQPKVVDGAFVKYVNPRFGNHLREALGERAFTVYLHAPWRAAGGYNTAAIHPADGCLDTFMLTRDGGPFATGFDVAASPLGDLPIENAVYMHGHEPFTLSKFCDGWIYTKPIGEYEPVTYIENWINEDNLEQARATAMNPRWRDGTVERLNAGCRSYMDDHQRFFRRLR